jgi:poly(hydroxyalkanoate) depolymerase family esterase
MLSITHDTVADAQTGLQERMNFFAAQYCAKPGLTGARFETRFHRLTRYRLFVPTPRGRAHYPLIVMLHGCNQSPEDFATATRMNDIAEEFGLLVAYPEQSAFYNPTATWRWFDANHQTRGEGEPAVIAGIVADIQDKFAVATDQIFVAGFSSGAALAVTMGATYPDVFAAVGAHSGLAHGAATCFVSALAAMRSGGRGDVGTQKNAAGRGVRTIVFHGDQDGTVNSINSRQIIQQRHGSRIADETSTYFPIGTTDSDVAYTTHVLENAGKRSSYESWDLHKVAHTWSGGSPMGSYTAPRGPDASREMVRFFLAT